MFYLLMVVVMSTTCAHILKVSQIRQAPILPLMAVNYFLALTGSLIGGGFDIPTGRLFLSLGLCQGVMFVFCLLMFRLSIDRLGLTLPTALMRLSAVAPTAASVILFNENPSLGQLIGVGLGFVILPLANREPWSGKDWSGMLKRGFGWALALFVGFGLVNMVYKIQAELTPTRTPFHFLAMVFGTALVVTTAVCIQRRLVLTKSALVFGLLFGAANLGSGYFMIQTVAHLPGVIAYPSLGVGVIGATALTSRIIWGERLRPANYLFLALAGGSLALIHLS